MNRMRNAVPCLSLGLLAATTWADTISLPLTDDAWINANNPGTNYGFADDIFVHNWGPKEGLVRFDAAAISGQTVNSATLELYLSSIRESGDISLHAITSSWNETTVTWNNKPPAEVVATAIISLTTGNAGGTVVIDVTEAIQRWANGGLADAGFLIVTGDGLKAYFDAKEKPGGIPASLEVDIGPPAFSGEAVVLDLSNPENCDISMPGHYVLDQTWLLKPTNLEEPNASCGSGVHISANDHVLLDFRGFAIRGGGNWGEYWPVLHIDTEARVTLRNGELQGTFVAIETTIDSDRHTITLENIRAGGGVLLGERPAKVTGGRFSATWETPLQVGAGSHVYGAEFACIETECLHVRGSSIISGCTFKAVPIGAPAVYVSGDGTIVERNIFDSWIGIGGNENLVLRNVSENDGNYHSIHVDGTGNVIEGNIGPSIAFQNTGNFFGDNRARLPGGFSGTDGNVDWGDNVTF